MGPESMNSDADAQIANSHHDKNCFWEKKKSIKRFDIENGGRKRKLTANVGLDFWLQGQHLIKADQGTEVNEDVHKDGRPLDFWSEDSFLAICFFDIRLQFFFDIFGIFWFRSP